MNILKVSNKDFDPNYKPTGRLDRVLNDIAFFLSVTEGEIPLKRTFGLTRQWVDLPMPQALSMVMQELRDKFKRFFPSVRVKKCEITKSSSMGFMSIDVYVEVLDG